MELFASRRGDFGHPGSVMLSYLFALLAACANAAASVLQRRVNRDLPREESLRPRLLRELLARPVWLGGAGFMVASFLLQAAALSNGQLSVVQPLLLADLPMTLLLASRVFRAPLHRREWLAIAGMTVGLAALLYFLDPRAGKSSSVAWPVWTAGAGANLLLVAGAVECGRRAGADSADERGAGRRAACYGVAGGCQFALTAALMKGATSRWHHGIGQIFTGWQLYAMAASGVLAVFLMQSAMRAGRLLAAQPGLSLADPVLAILWGVFAFGEQVRGGLLLVPAAVGGALLAVAAVVLGGSPLLKGQAAASEHGGRGRPAAAEAGE